MGTMGRQAGIEGRWSLVIGTPRGDRTATLVLGQHGVGTVTGMMNEIAIGDSAGADGRLTFAAQLTEPVTVRVRCSVSVEGDTP